VLVGGLGMGYTVRAVLDRCARNATVDVVELVPAVIAWNETMLGDLAGHPLRDPRTTVHVADVGVHLRRRTSVYDAILLDVDNGPTALAHAANDALYGPRGLREAWTALRPGGVLGIWSFADDPRFTTRLHRQGFTVDLHNVPGSRRGRGKHHMVWIARRAGAQTPRRRRP
jgi:spermidine synthase